jgi:osmoprotectant transport system substrate-binding protein
MKTASLAIVALLVVSACTRGTPEATPSGDSDAITVASFDFTESEILGELYAQALEAKGYPVRLLLDAGTRELIEPALAEGLVDLVPEYSGSALSFLTLGTEAAGASERDTHRALFDALASDGAIPLTASPAQDANAVVVTRQTAETYHLSSVSDLVPVASDLLFGGPPECPQRPFCLAGLGKVYGLTFRDFVPLDAGGPLTIQALRTGSVDVGLLFTADPAIAQERFVVLTDDQRLQPAENITPVIRQAVVVRYGSALVDAVNAVSKRLTTAQLMSLTGRVALDGEPAAEVAAEWLRDHGLSEGAL